MAIPPPKKGGGGMSLYANLLSTKQPSDSATISSAPVKYAQVTEATDGAAADAQLKKNGTVS